MVTSTHLNHAAIETLAEQSTEAEPTPNKKDTECGIGSFRPGWLHCFQNVPSFVGFYSLSLVVTSSVSVYLTSQITTLEKQFNLSSSISGLLIASNEIGFLATIVIFSHFARRLSIPGTLGVCTAVFGLSCLICVLPYLGVLDQIPSPPTDNYDNITQGQSVSAQLLCSNVSRSTTSSCDGPRPSGPPNLLQVSDQTRTLAIALIAVGMILQGAVKAPRLPYLSTYIDDNGNRAKTAFYLGITNAVFSCGPAIASTLGGVFSRKYVTLEETNMSPRDPRFIGAWWLGFAGFGCAALVFSVPVLLFPKILSLSHNSELRTTRSQTGPTIWQEMKDLLRGVLGLVGNPIYLFIILCLAVNATTMVGMLSFLPKYAETQFGVSVARTNISLGLTALVSTLFGSLTSGWITSRFKLTPTGCLKLIMSYLVMSTGIIALGLLAGCPNTVFRNINEAYGITGQAVNNQCNQSCLCDPGIYFPVCGSDGQSYFSPCLAGCLSVESSTFSNCSCIDSGGSQTATGGLCMDCPTFNYFLVIVFFVVMFGSMTFPPVCISLIRFAGDKNKPLALGLHGTVLSAFGFFLGPILYGHLVDSTCLLWKPTCTSRGVCSLYDIELFRLRYFGLSVALRVVSIALLSVAIVLAIRRRNVEEPQETDLTKQSQIFPQEGRSPAGTTSLLV